MVPVVIISALLIIANFWHVIWQWYANPSGSYFIGISHYYADYFLYASQIVQGIRGNWFFARQLYTDEPLPPTWIYWPNVLIGRMGGMFTHSPFMLYQISLIVCVLILLWLVWHVTGTVFPKNRTARIVAFLFAASASNFPDLKAWFSGMPFALVGNTWFSPTPALNRLGGVPHQTLQTILLFAVLLTYASFNSSPIKRVPFVIRSLAFGVLCFVTATLSPTQMVLVSGTIGAYALFRRSRNSAMPAGIGIAFAAAGAFLVNRAFDASPIFSAAKQWELAQTVPVSVPGFLIAIGPIILLAPFGIRSYVWNRLSPMGFMLAVYGLLSFAVFFSPVPALLSTSSVRWLHPAAYLFLPLLAAEGVIVLSRTAKRHASTVFFVLISGYILLTVPSIISQVQARSSADYLAGYLNHVPLPVFSALRALSDRPPGVILTSPDLPYDVLVPALTGHASFTGHIIHTENLAEKELLRKRYFGGGMTENEKRQFLATHHIRYILTGTPTAIRLETVTP